MIHLLWPTSFGRAPPPKKIGHCHLLESNCSKTQVMEIMVLVFFSFFFLTTTSLSSRPVWLMLVSLQDHGGHHSENIKVQYVPLGEELEQHRRQPLWALPDRGDGCSNDTKGTSMSYIHDLSTLSPPVIHPGAELSHQLSQCQAYKRSAINIYFKNYWEIPQMWKHTVIYN